MSAELQTNCPDCGTGIGEVHNLRCTVERCSVCFLQRFTCSCIGHNPEAVKWTGEWPGDAECRELGLYCVGVGQPIPGTQNVYRKYESCPPETPGATEDLNALGEIYRGLRPWPEQWKDRPRPLHARREESRRDNPTDLPFTGDVLWLNHPESDYGASFLWSGFQTVCGWKRIVDFPCKRSYHGESHKHIDLPEQNIYDGTCDPLPWMAQGTPARYGEVDARTVEADIRAGRFGLVVVESCRGEAVKAFRLFAPAIRAMGLPILLHDGEDWADFQGNTAPVVGEIRPTVFAKREWLRHNPFTARLGNGTLVVPCPFSAPDVLIARSISQWKAGRAKVDHLATFATGETHPDRGSVHKALKQAQEEGIDALPPGSVRSELLPFWDYITGLRSARCGISVRGWGWDTCRYWETAATTLLVAGPLGIHIPHPFTNVVNCLQFEHPLGAAALLAYIAEHPDKADALALAGWEHTLRHHTASARARQMLEYLTP